MFSKAKIQFTTYYIIILLWMTNCLYINVAAATVPDNTLEKLVKLFSMPGAFNRVNEILGGNTIDETSTMCPEGEEGMECRRAEARRSVDCPTGDCYCYNCAMAGPEMWPSCCRESSKCCSHLAAACRNCDHPILIPFCAEHFNKCLNKNNENPLDIEHSATTTSSIVSSITNS